MADRASVDQLFEWAARELKHVDILVNSAGVNVPKRLMADLAPENWDLLMEVAQARLHDGIVAIESARQRRAEQRLLTRIGSRGRNVPRPKCRGQREAQPAEHEEMDHCPPAHHPSPFALGAYQIGEVQARS